MRAAFRLILALALSLCAAAALAQPASFTADVVHTANGAPTLSGKAWIAPGKVRVESSIQGVPQVLITDTPGRRVIMLQPQLKLYMETKLDPAQAGADPMAQADAAQWQTVGRETIDGWECEKRVLKQDPAKGEMTAWFADKLGLPIRSVAKGPQGTATMEFRNIKVQPVEASRFAVPAGYQKMDLPPAVQGMIPGMKPAQ
ncbi:hypothetical protein NNJEOMEG_00668 [Fundidesulfovibrio magnetotacticus]|uniref:DUF4412 domain-containing protein n=1 Tax=Fundidesulfovibrio magnetotacticus TaxID=2730080 RepID=A0A6V8LPC2_9BACT|nr:DUF4412 domain-containing protein [Fundidesulfovibrio magnetotacticus]GFK92840.1 hypothetical protein NNJEOMEG_00668 [Fundidesulfovibrio magnetotacticus]